MYSFSGKCAALAPTSTIHIHVSVSNLYVILGSVHIFSCSRTGRSIVGIYCINCSKTHDCGVAAQLLFWEYLFKIFGIVSLQCSISLKNTALLRILATCWSNSPSHDSVIGLPNRGGAANMTLPLRSRMVHRFLNVVSLCSGATSRCRRVGLPLPRGWWAPPPPPSRPRSAAQAVQPCFSVSRQPGTP